MQNVRKHTLMDRHGHKIEFKLYQDSQVVRSMMDNMPDIKEFEYDQDYDTDEEALVGSKNSLKEQFAAAMRQHEAYPA